MTHKSSSRLGFILVFSLIINSGISMGMHKDKFFNDIDSAEASVPRHPAIVDSGQLEKVLFQVNGKQNELICRVSSGVPTPKVVWMREDQKELNTSAFTSMNDPKTGIAKLLFVLPETKRPAKEINGSLNGIYTCFAANFLGRAKKSFLVKFHE